MRMRRGSAVVLVLALCAMSRRASCEERFGRTLIALDSAATYHTVRVDDIDVPFTTGRNARVSCLCYRGSVRYYVEVGIENLTDSVLVVQPDDIRIVKPGYTIYRSSTLAAAADVAQSAGVEFVPVPAPSVGTTTVVQGTATSHGTGSTSFSGRATTAPSAGQTGANIGNAIGNAFAARRFAKAQNEESRFATFLSAFALESEPVVLLPGQTRILIASFEQVKLKKAPFSVHVGVGADTLRFHYRE